MLPGAVGGIPVTAGLFRNLGGREIVRKFRRISGCVPIGIDETALGIVDEYLGRVFRFLNIRTDRIKNTLAAFYGFDDAGLLFRVVAVGAQQGNVPVCLGIAVGVAVVGQIVCLIGEGKIFAAVQTAHFVDPVQGVYIHGGDGGSDADLGQSAFKVINIYLVNFYVDSVYGYQGIDQGTERRVAVGKICVQRSDDLVAVADIYGNRVHIR